MSATYSMCVGNRGVATRCGGKDGVHVAAQAWDGSVIVRNWYREDDNGNETLMVRVGTNNGSSCSEDWNGESFRGTFEEFKQALTLLKQIKDGSVSVVRHRKNKFTK